MCGLYWKRPDPKYERILERCMKYPGMQISTRVAIDLGRNRIMRQLIDDDKAFIGNNRRRRKSIIFFPPNVKIRRGDDGFWFDFF